MGTTAAFGRNLPSYYTKKITVVHSQYAIVTAR